jgi:hypothetical protein
MITPDASGPVSQPLAPATIVRTYSSMPAFRADELNMAVYGYAPTSVQQTTQARGCLIAILILLFWSFIALVLISLVGFERLVSVVYTYSPQQAAYAASLPPLGPSVPDNALSRFFIWSFGRDLSANECFFLFAAIALVAVVGFLGTYAAITYLRVGMH